MMLAIILGQLSFLSLFCVLSKLFSITCEKILLDCHHEQTNTCQSMQPNGQLEALTVICELLHLKVGIRESSQNFPLSPESRVVITNSWAEAVQMTVV
jgi:hypothetical protein